MASARPSSAHARTKKKGNGSRIHREAVCFPNGQLSPHTYVILCEGCHYAVRHGVVARSIVDNGLRKRIGKQGKPKALT